LKGAKVVFMKKGRNPFTGSGHSFCLG